MHKPLQHAADTMLRRTVSKSLDEWLIDEKNTQGTLLSVRMSRDTDEVIIIDKRTAEKWRDTANA